LFSRAIEEVVDVLGDDGGNALEAFNATTPFLEQYRQQDDHGNRHPEEPEQK
jgi:hypothetical protein